MKKTKALFDDDDDDNDNDVDDKTLHVNEQFAARYEHSKKAQELNRLRAKYGADDNDDDNDDASSSTTEDSDAALDTDAKDAAFLRILPLLVSKDPARLEIKAPVFPDEDEEEDNNDDDQGHTRQAKPAKPVFMADFVRQQLLEKGAEALLGDDDDAPPVPTDELPYAREQEALKRAFADAAAADDDDNDDDDSAGGLLVKRGGGALPAAKKARTAAVESKLADSSVKAFWTASAGVDEGEKFLRDYIVHQRWKAKGDLAADDQDDAADGSDVLGEDQVSIAKHFNDVDSEDESEVQLQEEFEHRYNFRFEEPGGTQLITHPRTANEESARRKDTRRAARRKARAERLAAQKAERDAETKRLKTLARQQLATKVEKLRKISALEQSLLVEQAKLASADADKLTFNEDDLGGDFDPDAHDRRMKELFGELFYDKLQADTKKPVFDDDDDDAELEELIKEAADFEAKPEHEDVADDDDDNDDDGDGGDGEKDLAIPVFDEEELRQQQQEADEREQSTSRSLPDTLRRKRKLPKLGTFAALRARLQNEVERGVGDYLELDYEDVIAGEIKTRFRYVDVEPVSADMDEVEILKTPDVATNQLLPLRKLAPYRDVKKLKKTKWSWKKQEWLNNLRQARREREQDAERQKRERREARAERRSNKDKKKDEKKDKKKDKSKSKKKDKKKDKK